MELFESLPLQNGGPSDERESTMKRLRKPVSVVLLGVGTALIFAVPAFAQQKDAQVTITDTRIEIHPGTKISESDQKALNEVLKKYDKLLYKIETLKDGKVTGQVQGKLEDKYIDATLAAEVKQAKAAGSSDTTEQTADHKNATFPVTAAAVQNESQVKELIQALKPILEKYSKK
jgi:hypothetical protein